jgi:TfoX/Sxy family transcriptional regulator of competence genes
MASATWKKSPPDLIERFSKALPVRPDLVRKPMFGYPAAFVNGNMACGLFRDSVVVRLGKEASANVVAAGKAQPFVPMPGRSMGGYVLVPADATQDTKLLSAWLQRAVEHAASLPGKAPKPAAKRPASAKAAR